MVCRVTPLALASDSIENSRIPPASSCARAADSTAAFGAPHLLQSLAQLIRPLA